MNSNGNLILK